MTNEILSYISALAFFQDSASIMFSEIIALVPHVQTSEFYCIASSAAWLGKVMFTEKEPALLK